MAKLSKEREASQIRSIHLQIVSLLWKVLISFYKLCQICKIDIHHWDTQNTKYSDEYSWRIRLYCQTSKWFKRYEPKLSALSVS